MFHKMWFVLIIFCALEIVQAQESGEEVGCFAFNSSSAVNIHIGQSVDVCLSQCEQLYYRYTLISDDSTCFCGNSPGSRQVPIEACNIMCPKNSTQRCGGETVASVYDTGVTTPGPPQNVAITNYTETTVRVRWDAPEAYTIITGYSVMAVALHTYNNISKLLPKTWKAPNNTFHMVLISLQPGTEYNISVAANNDLEIGPAASEQVVTIIGTPDPSPVEPNIVRRYGDKMVIHIPPSINENGPITFYRIVVSIEVYQQGFIPEYLDGYNKAMEEGLPYYIAAEIDPEDIKDDFTVGDGHTYNGFYNAPLPLTNDIDIAIGVVSELNGVRKIRYADAAKKVIINVNEEEEVSGLVVALSAAIAIGVVLLLIGVGLVIILKKKIEQVRAERCSQSMPLSVSEPCLEIENSGFYPEEEEEHTDHYSNLKRKLLNIPRNQIEIDISCVAGIGTYGKFTKGKVQQHGGYTQSLIQIIADKDLSRPDRRLMLHELDLLIKTNEHENVISLIGISETPNALLVVIEDIQQTFKELLVSSRHRDLQNNKFSLISESKVIQICSDISRGMQYLHSKKISHKRLCCRNIALAGGVTKVSGFGLSHIHPLNEMPDYTRWTAHEMLQQSRFTNKADIWSFGCLLWEAMTLGATPYAQVPSRDVAARVLKGLRPLQPSYVGDDLFQLCLQCWQIDPDERPNFSSIRRELEAISGSYLVGSISFTNFNDFSYEPYMNNLEVL